MNGSRRGVGAFMAIGLAIAVIVGFAVWGASTPGRTSTAGYAADTATVEQTTSPKSSRSSAASDTEGSESANSASRSGAGHSTLALTSQTLADSGLPPTSGVYGIEGEALLNNAPGRPNPNYRMESDPYAPPLAVTSAPRSTAPTAIYRPTNVVPPTASGGDATEPAPGPATATATATATAQTPDTNGVTTPPSTPADGVQTSAPAEPGPATTPDPAPPQEQVEHPRPDSEAHDEMRTNAGSEQVTNEGRAPASSDTSRESATPAPMVPSVAPTMTPSVAPTVTPSVAETAQLESAPAPQGETAPAEAS